MQLNPARGRKLYRLPLRQIIPNMVYAAQPREGTETYIRLPQTHRALIQVYAAQPREGTETRTTHLIGHVDL